VQIVGNGHTDAQDERVGDMFQHVLDAGFGVGVEAPAEVGGVFLREGLADECPVVRRVGGGVDACAVAQS
jgi:hypothetical protein